MARLSAITRLLQGLQSPPHQYSLPTGIFPSLNAEKLASDMLLAEKGTRRGQENLPATGSKGFDQIEQQIINRIEEERRATAASYADQLQTYSDRSSALNFQSRFAEIQQAAPDAVAEFCAEALKGRNQLNQLRRRIIETESERESFKTRHKLRRPARMSAGGTQLLKIGVLLVVAVFEIAMNAVFLAKGNEQGVVGGAAQALGFALLNIGVSFVFGLWPIRLVNHRSIPIKLIGAFGTVSYIAFAVALNLALSHYREVSGMLTSDAGLEVISRLKTAPLGLHDLGSWLFFGIGLFFSIIAMADGIFFKDPYPGFDRVERACVAAHDDYNHCVSDLIEQLRNIKDQASDDVRAVMDDLNLKFGEYDSIINARARLNNALSDHQTHLERAAHVLLFNYRDANRQARSSDPPAHFVDSFNLPSIPTVTDVSSNAIRDGLLASISNMQELLNGSIDSVKKEFVAAVRSYREIDDLVPEKRDETISKAA